MGSDSEDDYMTMDFTSAFDNDVRPGLIQTPKQKRELELLKRKQEFDAKFKANKKKNLKVLEAEYREEGLRKPIEEDNKGFALLAKMGYKPGGGIGKTAEKQSTPTALIDITVKTSRKGLGLEERRPRPRPSNTKASKSTVSAELSASRLDAFRSALAARHGERKLQGDLGRSQRICATIEKAEGWTKPLEWWYWPESELEGESPAEEPLRDDEHEDCNETSGDGGNQTENRIHSYVSRHIEDNFKEKHDRNETSDDNRNKTNSDTCHATGNDSEEDDSELSDCIRGETNENKCHALDKNDEKNVEYRNNETSDDTRNETNSDVCHSNKGSDGKVDSALSDCIRKETNSKKCHAIDGNDLEPSDVKRKTDSKCANNYHVKDCSANDDVKRKIGNKYTTQNCHAKDNISEKNDDNHAADNDDGCIERSDDGKRTENKIKSGISNVKANFVNINETRDDCGKNAKSDDFTIAKVANTRGHPKGNVNIDDVRMKTHVDSRLDTGANDDDIRDGGNEGCGDDAEDDGWAKDNRDEEDDAYDENEEDYEDTLSTEEKLKALTRYLRSSYFYCVWCGTRYQDETDLRDNCPGDTSDEH